MRRANSILLLIAAFSASAATNWCGTATTGNGSGADLNNRMVLPDSTSFTRGDVYKIIEGNYGGRTLREAESGTTLVTIQKVSTADSAIAGYASSLHDGVAQFEYIRIFTDDWRIDGVTGGGPGSWDSGHGIEVNGQIHINPPYNDVFSWTAGHGDNVTLEHIHIAMGADYSNDDGVNSNFTTGLTNRYLYYTGIDNCPLQLLDHNELLWEYCYVPYQGFCSQCDENVHGEIASMEGGGSYVIRWNLFKHVWSTGGLLFDNKNNSGGMQVYGNVFYREAGHTWSYGPSDGVIGGWTTPGNVAPNVRVINNTFINVPQICIGSMSGVTAVNATCKNNLFYNTATGLPNGKWSADYNHYVDSGSESESNGTTASGNPFVSLSINNASAFRLTADTSPSDVTISQAERTDWNGHIHDTRGAIQFESGSPDVTPPLLSSATIDSAGTTLTLLFNEAVSGATSGANGLALTPSGGAATLSYSSGNGTVNRAYTINRTINVGETVTIAASSSDLADGAANALANFSGTTVVNNSGQGQVETPEISLAAGAYYNAANVTITTDTPDADIYYTLDGSTPDDGDTEYTGAITLPTGATTLKAIAIKSGSVDSGVATADYENNEWVATVPFKYVLVPTQSTNPVTFRVDVTANAGGSSATCGLHTEIIDGSVNLAGLFRLNASGNVFEAYDGNAWTADSVITWSAGVSYEVEVVIDRDADTYDVTIDGAALATAFDLPTSQLSATDFDYIGFISGGGTATFSNLEFGDDAGDTPAAPTITVGNVTIGTLNVR